MLLETVLIWFAVYSDNITVGICAPQTYKDFFTEYHVCYPISRHKDGTLEASICRINEHATGKYVYLFSSRATCLYVFKKDLLGEIQ
jgi:hypothetical protein